MQFFHLLLFKVVQTDRANAVSTTAYNIKYYHKHDLVGKNFLIFNILVPAQSPKLPQLLSDMILCGAIYPEIMTWVQIQVLD